MAYLLSATKLQTYARCPRAYYYRYEYGLKGGGMFGSAVLGNALHRALDAIYKDWHYNAPLPPLDWLQRCWTAQRDGLSAQQTDEGWRILMDYYDQHIIGGRFQRPIATEGRVDGNLVTGGIEFKLLGRYDRLDALPQGGLALIDYKSAKQPQPPAPDTVELQLGLYALALEQRYGQSLKSMQLVYLRTGQVASFDVTPDHRQQIEATVSQLAMMLITDDAWQPHCGDGCARCSYAQYCPAVTDSPEALPERQRKGRSLQLSLLV